MPRRPIPGAALLLLALLSFLPVGHAEDEGVGDALDGLSGTDALALVKELAADEMKGRKTSFNDGVVENWLLQKFSEFGLHPAMMELCCASHDIQ